MCFTNLQPSPHFSQPSLLSQYHTHITYPIFLKTAEIYHLLKEMAATFLLNILYLMFSLACVSVLETRGLASFSSLLEVAPSPPPDQEDVSEDMQQCWSPMENIQGCTQQIYGSFFSSQFRIIGPACCKAISESTTTCRQKLFPSNSIFPPLLATRCPQSQPPSPTTMLTQLSASDPFPFFQPGQQIWQCFGAILNTQGCAFQIYTAVMTGQFRQISSACCYAITQVTSDCWPKLFPFNPFMPQLLNSTCGFFSAGGGATQFAVSKTPLPRSLPVQQSGPEITQCWATLRGIDGCVTEISVALSDGRIGYIGSHCCMAVSNVNNSCWSKMLPLNPLFPPLLRRYCYSNGPVPAPDHIY